MGKKKFIDKKKAATFQLMFRDSSDPDARPGEKIFVRTDEGTNYIPGFSDDYPAGSSRFGGSEFGDGDHLDGRDWPDEEADIFADAGEDEGGETVVPRGRARVRESGTVGREEIAEEEVEAGELRETAEGSGPGDSLSGLRSTDPSRERSGSVGGRRSGSRPARSTSRAGSSSRPPRFAGDFWWAGEDTPLTEEKRREVLELGLPDDGYDYTQHLRAIGTARDLGVFLQAELPRAPPKPDVKVYDASRVKPPSAPQSDAELTNLRVMDAVSSRTREIRRPGGTPFGLDPEIAAALENSEGSEPGSEDELEDDFVMKANAGGDSEAEGAGPVGERYGGKRDQGIDEGEDSDNWEEEEEPEGGEGVRVAHGGGGGRRQGRGRATLKSSWGVQRAGKPAEEGEGMLDEEEDDDEWETDEEEEEAEWSKRGELRERAQDRPARLLDEQFEKLALREYDDEELGELDEDDPEARGHADISQFDSVLDEFLVETRDFHSLGEARGALGSAKGGAGGPDSRGGVRGGTRDTETGPPAQLREGAETSAQQGLKGAQGSEEEREWANAGGAHEVAGGQEGSAPAVAVAGNQGVHGEAALAPKGRIREGQESAATLDVEEEGEEEEDVVLTSDEDEPREQWDCESIVSTYSNLDNHPGRIQAPGRRKQPKPPMAPPGGLIRLGGREQLPVDYLPRRSGGPSSGSQGRLESRAGPGDGGSEHGSGRPQKVVGRSGGETPEEKKARKRALKEQRREARGAKKTLREVYKHEGVRAQHGAAHMAPQGIHLQ